MRRSHYLAVVGLLALGIAPAVRAAAPDDLASRIDHAAHSPLPNGAEAQMQAFGALKAEADRTPALDPLSRATTERLYAAALSAARRPVAEVSAVEQRGVEILTKAGLTDSSEMAELLEALAEGEDRLQHLDKAMELARRAEAIELRIYGEHSPELFLVRTEIGRIEALSGRLGEAIVAYRRALDPVGEPRPEHRINHIINTLSLGTFLSRHGDEDEALRVGYRALDEAKRWLPEDHRGWSPIYSNLAGWLANAGRLGEAESVAREAVARNLARYGAKNFDTGASQRVLANILFRQGRNAEARSVAEAAVKALDDHYFALQNPVVAADASRLLARIALAEGDYAAAEAHVAAGQAALVRDEDHSGFSAYLQATAAAVLFARGHYPQALTSIDAALPGLRRSLAPYAGERVAAELLRAEILLRLEQKDAAWQAAEPQGHLIEERLADAHVTGRALATMPREYRANLARLAVVAAETGHAEAAFRAGQLAAYTELSASSRAIAARLALGPAGPQLRRVQDLQDQADRLERERGFALGKSAEEVAAINQRIAAGGAALDIELAALRRAFPAYDSLTRPALMSSPAAAALGKGEALLLPIDADDRLLVMVVTPRGLSLVSTPVEASVLARSVAALRQGSENAAPFDAEAAWQLGRAMFAPGVLRALDGTREVAVLGAGPLMTLPPGMLLTAPPRPGGARAQPYALRRFAFSVRPMLEADLGRETHGATAFLGVGAPQLGPARDVLRGGAVRLRGGEADGTALRELPSLPGTEAELTAISAAIPAADNRVLTGAAATEAALRAEPLQHFGVIAFATHGLIGGELGGLREPALVLTPPAGAAASSDNDGLLTASEAAGLRLDARWVILSACNTGSGSESGAGGYSGLARGFMQAGAQSLLVSLWPLRDDVARRLTVDTVRLNAAGLNQAQALRRATLRLIADRSVADGGEPAVWAPFSLVRR